MLLKGRASRRSPPGPPAEPLLLGPCRHMQLAAPELAVLVGCSNLTKLTQLRLTNPTLGVHGRHAPELAAGSLPRSLHTLWCMDGLSSIPPALAAATWLQHLGLSNEWEGVDLTGLDSLVGLTALELPQCLMGAVPPQLSALTALRQLRLSENFLSGGAPSWQALSALQRLSSLSFHSCGLCELPAVLSQLSALKVGGAHFPLSLLPSPPKDGARAHILPLHCSLTPELFLPLQELDVSWNPLKGALGPAFSQLERLAISPVALMYSQQLARGGRAALRELYLVVGGDRDRSPVCLHSLTSLLCCLPALARLALDNEAAQQMGAQGAGGLAALVELCRQRPGLQIEAAPSGSYYFGGVAPSQDCIDLE